MLPFGGIYQSPQRRRSTALTLAARVDIFRGGVAAKRRCGRLAATSDDPRRRSVARSPGSAASRSTAPPMPDDRVAAREAPEAPPARPAPRPRRVRRGPAARGLVPEQIAGPLRKHHPAGSVPPTRRSVHNTTTGRWRSQNKGAVSICERPLEVEDRAVPGHWKGDLLLGRHWTQLATLVERTTRFTVLVQLDGRDMQAVTADLSREMAKLPDHVRRSLTWDRSCPDSAEVMVGPSGCN